MLTGNGAFDAQHVWSRSESFNSTPEPATYSRRRWAPVAGFRHHYDAHVLVFRRLQLCDLDPDMSRQPYRRSVCEAHDRLAPQIPLKPKREQDFGYLRKQLQSQQAGSSERQRAESVSLRRKAEDALKSQQQNACKLHVHEIISASAETLPSDPQPVNPRP